MNRLLLVDGSNLLFQMFFGMPARIRNRNGKAVHGAIGFVGALLKILRMTEPTHVAVLFDGEHENARKEMNADYKANRTDYGAVPEEENPFSQLCGIYAALDAMGIKRAETTVCETDDWIAGYALTYGKDMQIVISSHDSDYFQLLNENVSVLRYRGKQTAIIGADDLRRRYGVAPAQYADFKALVGDASDNIKGAEKIGEKTAAELLQQFGTLQSLLENAALIAKPSVRASVINGAARLQTNYGMIRLTQDAALPFPLETLTYRFTEQSTTRILTDVGLLP